MSWLAEFGVQEDHLHSSSTLWQPFSTGHYVTVQWYILPHLVFLGFAACYMLYHYYIRALEVMRPTSRDLIFLSILMWIVIVPKYSACIIGVALAWLLLSKPYTNIPKEHL